MSGGGAPQNSFLGSLPEEARARLQERASVRRYGRGEAIFHEHQVPGDVIVLLSGRVKIFSVEPGGREVVLAIREPGDLLGEQSALDGDPRSASAVALDLVEALVVGRGDFRAFLRHEPDAALWIMAMLSRRLRDADLKRREFSARDTLGRVAGRLVELAERYGEQDQRGLRIDLPLTQEELAAWTGSSREAVAKALHALRELRLIETARREVMVLDIDALRRHA